MSRVVVPPTPVTAWLGLPDPAAAGGDAKSLEVRERKARERLMDGLEEVLAALGGTATSRQVVDALAEHGDRFAVLREALAEYLPAWCTGEALEPSPLTTLLGSLEGEQPGGRLLVRGRRTCTGVPWSLRRLERAA